jgi:hypothetical protein
VLANDGWICPAVLTFVLARLSNVGGNCGRTRQACATASLYLHRDGAADHDLRGGVRFTHADRYLPRHKHSGGQRRLQLYRPAAR